MSTQGLVILVLILLTVYFFTTRAEHLQRYKNITTHPKQIKKESFRDNIQPLNYDASMAFHKINFDKDAEGNTDADYYLASKLYKQ